jgi:predicted nucleotidyltransferase
MWTKAPSVPNAGEQAILTGHHRLGLDQGEQRPQRSKTAPRFPEYSRRIANGSKPGGRLMAVPTGRAIPFVEAMEIICRAEMTPEIVTVSERKAREAAHRRSAAREVMALVREFAVTHRGRRYVFGSVAEDRMKYDSDFDVVVDFPPDMETEAAEFVENANQRLDLPCDVNLKSRATDKFLDRIRDQMVILP